MKRKVFIYFMPCVVMLFSFISNANTKSASVLAILPVETKNIDEAVAEIFASAIEEESVNLGWILKDKKEIEEIRPGACVSATCKETADFIELAKSLGADAVIYSMIEKQEDGINVIINVYKVSESSSNAASKFVKGSALIVTAKQMIKQMLGKAQAPPLPPSPPLSQEHPETVQKSPQEQPSTGVVPPGMQAEAETPGAGEKGEKAEKADNELKAGTEIEKGTQAGQNKEKVPPDQSGRIPVIAISGIYASALGIGILGSAGVSDWRIYLPVSLLGGAGGVVISLISTRKFKVTRGDAAMFGTILGWSVANGILIPAAAGSENAQRYALGGTISGGIGLALAIAVTALSDPYMGDATLMSSIGFWGAAYAEMFTGFALPDEGKKWFIAGLVGLDIGLVAGGISSVWIDFSPRMAGVMTGIGLLGSVLGVVGGVAFIAKEDPSDSDWRAFDGIVLAGTTLGIIGGVFIAEIVEKRADQKNKVNDSSKKNEDKIEKTSLLPFLVFYSRDRGWLPGIPYVQAVSNGKEKGVILNIAGGIF